MARRVFVALLLMAGTLAPVPARRSPALLRPGVSPSLPHDRVDSLIASRASRTAGTSRVIVRAVNAGALAALAPVVRALGGRILRTLTIVEAHAIELPNVSLRALAASPLVARLSYDRGVAGAMERTAAAVGATAVREDLGLDGAGVGIAILDSGITPWHDDLAAPEGGQRVDRFVDFVGGRAAPYDDYGHGTHVAGIIAGDGFDSSGARAGIAPGARLTVLKVLDDQGNGRTSDVIAALEYILVHRQSLNIRVANLSVASGVYESYRTDPLAHAIRRVVDAGVVVIAAAGNRGRTPEGLEAYGGVTGPGNVPWVLTVGASSHAGTVARDDDRVAVFSSRGPTPHDYSAKPDLVAPGVGIESLSDPDSAFYIAKAPYLLAGTMPMAYLPYLSLTGTSMAAPVVAGTVALMLQADPELTPNAVKAILQFTAEPSGEYDPLTQGAGFLNAAAAVEVARLFADGVEPIEPRPSWSGHIIWDNGRLTGGRIDPRAAAWQAGLAWGAARAPGGEPIAWPGWERRNVVWGTACGGADCGGPWSTGAAGIDGDERVVWGTTEPGALAEGASADGHERATGAAVCHGVTCDPVNWRPR